MDNLPLNFLSLPIWWYTTGLGEVWFWVKRKFFWALNKTGLPIFIRYINQPLYGDYTKSGLIMSFIVRLFLIIFKSAALFCYAIFLFSVIIFYLLLLPVVSGLVIYQLIPS